MHRLTAVQIRSLPPGKYNDGAGLWLHKRPDGGAQWVLRVTIAGRRREMGLGSLSEVSPREARAEAERWRKVAAAGRDPIRERERLGREVAAERPTLAHVAHECFDAAQGAAEARRQGRTPVVTLGAPCSAKLGRLPIEDLDQNHIRSALAPIWHDKGETARKAITRLKVVLKRAVAMGLSVDLQATDRARPGSFLANA